MAEVGRKAGGNCISPFESAVLSPPRERVQTEFRERGTKFGLLCPTRLFISRELIQTKKGVGRNWALRAWARDRGKLGECTPSLPPVSHSHCIRMAGCKWILWESHYQALPLSLSLLGGVHKARVKCLLGFILERSPVDGIGGSLCV